VKANELRYIGKETDRRWEQGEEISILDTFTLEYRPDETANLKTDPDLQRKVREHSIRALAEAAGVSTRTVKAARERKRLRKSTIDKLEKALLSPLPLGQNHTLSIQTRHSDWMILSEAPKFRRLLRREE
jgi:hypothetical protein